MFLCKVCVSFYSQMTPPFIDIATTCKFLNSFICYASLKQRETDTLPPTSDSGQPAQENDNQDRRKDEIPMIYLCATMWHELKKEMEQILKSIFR